MNLGQPLTVLVRVWIHYLDDFPKRPFPDNAQQIKMFGAKLYVDMIRTSLLGRKSLGICRIICMFCFSN